MFFTDQKLIIKHSCGESDKDFQLVSTYTKAGCLKFIHHIHIYLILYFKNILIYIKFYSINSLSHQIQNQSFIILVNDAHELQLK